jgi:hypothetical protein
VGWPVHGTTDAEGGRAAQDVQEVCIVNSYATDLVHHFVNKVLQVPRLQVAVDGQNWGKNTPFRLSLSQRVFLRNDIADPAFGTIAHFVFAFDADFVLAKDDISQPYDDIWLELACRCSIVL